MAGVCATNIDWVIPLYPSFLTSPGMFFYVFNFAYEPPKATQFFESLQSSQQAGYLFPNTPMAVEQLLHLRSNSTARPFNISFSPDPTSCHYCPYTTIGADINITGRDR
jgi:hypothetical protein